MPKITILADLLGTDHIQKFYRHPEFDVFILAGQGENLDRLDGLQRIDHVPNHELRGRGPAVMPTTSMLCNHSCFISLPFAIRLLGTPASTPISRSRL